MSKITAALICLISFIGITSSENIEITPTIVGGQDATLGQFPYMVSLQYSGDRGSHGCGGGILNERWILTAAHCLLFITPDIVQAIVGTVTIDEGGYVYDVEEIIRHPRYIPAVSPFYTSNWNDIGLIKTKIPIVFNEFVQPVPLGTRRIFGNIPAVVAGYGAYFPNITIHTPSEEWKMSRTLQFMNTEIITHSECSQRTMIFNALNPFYPVKPIIRPDTCICTLQPRGIGLCFGDSGSMMLANGEVVGIVVSGVRVCAQANGAPDIYVRVSSYIDWIQNYIKNIN